MSTTNTTTSVQSKSRTRNLYNIQVAPVTVNTDTTYTAGTKQNIKGAIAVKLTDNYESEMIYSDGAVEEVLGEFIDGDIEMEISRLAPQERQVLLDQVYKNGFLVKSDSDTPPENAISFVSELKNGKQEFTQLYCVVFNQGEDLTYNTKKDKIETQTNTLKGKYYARKKGQIIEGRSRHLYEMVIDEEQLISGNTDAATAVTAWLNAVQEPVLTTQQAGSGGVPTGNTTDDDDTDEE